MAKNIEEMTREFVGAITEEYGLDQTFAIITERVIPILGECGVAKWDFYYIAPKGKVFDGDARKKIEFVISQDVEIDTEDIISRRFTTPVSGCVEFVMYHKTGATWSMREQLDYVMNLIFIIMGRARVYHSYEEVNSTDSLTGVPNRLALSRFAAGCQAGGTSQNYTSSFINIKNFKWINDKYGSGVGDRYLVEFCNSVVKYIEKDEFFGRLGGDNFVVIVKNENVDKYTEKLKDIRFSFQSNEGQLIDTHTKVRAGVYAMQPGDGMHEMMQAITSALQYARMPDTEDLMWYEPYMAERGKKLRDVQDAFPKALKKKEFLPFYQPKVSLDNMMLCGAEALCRWKKGDSFVPPMDFIPTLEMDRSIVKLDLYMLDRVCCDISDMYAKGLNPGRISVNFSKYHMHDKKTAKKIIDIIDKHHVDHENIEIELTEMYAYEEFEDIRAFIKDMRDAGIIVSLDDFGTGYSSLNMLTGLDVDIVKLDKSFMDDIENRPQRHLSMVKNIIRMINDLNMETIAEGIETKEQYELLKTWDCMMIQGYCFDKPMALEDYENRVRNPYYEL